MTGNSFNILIVNNNNNIILCLSITISFFAKIEKADHLKGYMILSKGYAPINGSYDIFVWDGKIYFELGGVGYLSVYAEPYVGAWHHFIFTYNGEEMKMYVDGSPVVSKPASGLIKVSSYDLEIGRDGERKTYYFVGLIDEIQISNKPLNIIDFVRSYYTYYASRIRKLHLPKGQVGLFRVIKEKKDIVYTQGIKVKSSRVSADRNYTVTFEVQMESPGVNNVTILIATDRFTKVYTISLNSGYNIAEYSFQYNENLQAGGLYWLHLSQARLIVISENGSIIYTKFITCQNLKLINNILLTSLAGILCLYLAISYRKEH